VSTYSTDDQIDATDTLAREALEAFSAAAVRRSAPPVTDYEDLRTEAKRQILMALAARGISEGQITDPAPLELVEVSLTLANLFQSVGQWSGTIPDVYVLKSQQYRALYAGQIATVNPRTAQRPTGRSFGWNRG
jgi:hypothetical protein